MSFNSSKNTDLEANLGSSRYQDFPEFETLSQSIDNKLYNVNNNQLVSIKNLLLQHDATDATKAARVSAKLAEVFTKTTQTFTDINETTTKLNEYLKTCESNHEDPDQISYLRQKESILIKLIKGSMSQYQKLQKRYEELQKSPLPEYLDGSPKAPSNAQQQEQQQVHITYEPINAEELEARTLFIQEREREIHQISQDTMEINEIFANLQDIVTEQQLSVDNIEDNILSFSNDVRGATTELRRAERYQKRSGGRMFCCLLILLGVVGTIVFIGVVF